MRICNRIVPTCDRFNVMICLQTNSKTRNNRTVYNKLTCCTNSRSVWLAKPIHFHGYFVLFDFIRDEFLSFFIVCSQFIAIRRLNLLKEYWERNVNTFQ